MSGGGGTNTTVQSNAPPQQFIDAYSQAVGNASNVASTPYTPYPGNIVAPMSPDQTGAIGTVESAQGIAAPFINNAAQHLDAATAPIWNDPNVQHFSPDTVRQYESPYTNDVVNATAAEFQNQNDISNQRVVGDAISHGAWGGDRSAVAQAINEGQNTRAQAPVLAGLRNQGYAQALQEFNTQQGAGLGATQAQRWLDSQAAAGMGNLGQEALGTTLTGANAQLGIGGLEQTQAQAELNVPYQQYIAQQAYPFQTAGWFSNIAEGLGGASGGTARTTTPGPSAVSQLGGLATAGVGLAGQMGAFNGLGSSPSFNYAGYGSGASVAPIGYAHGGTVRVHNLNPDDAVMRRADGGPVPSGFGVGIPMRADGGITGFNSPIDPTAPSIGGSPIDSMTVTNPNSGVPDVAISVVPGASGAGAGPATHGKMDILKDYGTTSTTTGGSQDSTLGGLIKLGGQIAAGIWGGPAGAAAAGAVNSQLHFNHGGGIAPFPMHRSRAPGTGIAPANDDGPFQHRAFGGIAVPQLATPSPMVTTIPSTHGGPAVPQLLPPAGGGAASAPTGLADYFARTQAGRSFAPPPNMPTLNFAMPAAAPVVPATSDAGIGPGPQNVFGGDTTPTQGGGEGGAGDGGEGGGGGDSGSGDGGEGEWRGGIVGRDEGGDVPDDPNGTVWKPDPEEPEPATAVPGFTGIGPSIPSDGAAPEAPAPGPALLSKTPAGLFQAASQAVHLNESNGRMTPGILGDGGKSGGPMQVQQAALDAVNRQAGTRITFDQMVRDPTIGKAVGDAFLDMLMTKYPGHPEYAIGAYNAGEGAMNRAIQSGRGVAGLPASTQVYVARAMRNMAGMMNGAPQQIARGGIVGLADGGADPSGLLIPGASATPDPIPTEDDQGDSDIPVPPIPPVNGPPPIGQGIAPTPTATRPDTETPDRPTVSPWQKLMNVGLGIMSGTSPHPLVNVGRGALTGLQMSDKEQTALETAALRRDQQKTNAMWRAGQAALADARAKHIPVAEDQGQQKLDQSGALNAARAEYLQWKSAHGDATLEQQNAKQAEINRRNGVREDQGQQKLDQGTMRLGQGDRRLDQGQQRVDNQGRSIDVRTDQGNRRLDQTDQTIALRRDAMKTAADDRERALIERASASDLTRATSLVSSSRDVMGKPTLTLAKALDQVRVNRPVAAPTARPAVTPAPAITAPAAPTAAPTAAPQFIEGKTYVDGQGNRAIYQGGQFVPAP